MSNIRKTTASFIGHCVQAACALLLAVPVAAEPVTFSIGVARGWPGEIVDLSLTMTADEGQRITFVSSDLPLAIDGAAAILPRSDAEPECSGVDVSSFAFVPRGCTLGVDCGAVRAITFRVVTEPRVEVISSCRYVIAADAGFGLYETGCIRSAYSAGDAPTDSLCEKGAIRVLCTGDCNRDATVTIDEILIGVAVALEETSLTRCVGFDANRDGRVSVNEILRAVNCALVMDR